MQRIDLRHSYPGIERPGIPTWKSGMLPELTFPEIFAAILKFASMLPSNAAQRLTCQSR